MLMSTNIHLSNGEHSVTVYPETVSLKIRSNVDLYSGITLFLRDHADLETLATVLREACNPRQPADDRAPEIVDEMADAMDELESEEPWTR